MEELAESAEGARVHFSTRPKHTVDLESKEEDEKFSVKANESVTVEAEEAAEGEGGKSCVKAKPQS